jgi:hypothetical protein
MLVGVSLGLKAQADSTEVLNIPARDVFISMPDSLLPTLNRNNRLDLVDYIESGLKAEVKNRFEGQTELLYLTSDSLLLQVSKGLTVEMLLLPLEETVIDNCKKVVCMVERFGTSSDSQECRVSLYSLKWRQVDDVPLTHDAQQKLEQLKLSTNLKWKEIIINKN